MWRYSWPISSLTHLVCKSLGHKVVFSDWCITDDVLEFEKKWGCSSQNNHWGKGTFSYFVLYFNTTDFVILLSTKLDKVEGMNYIGMLFQYSGNPTPIQTHYFRGWNRPLMWRSLCQDGKTEGEWIGGSLGLGQCAAAFSLQEVTATQTSC